MGNALFQILISHAHLICSVPCTVALVCNGEVLDAAFVAACPKTSESSFLFWAWIYCDIFSLK